MSVFAYNFATGEQTLLKRNEILGGYDATGYTVERVQVRAGDGTAIPLDVIRRKMSRATAKLLLVVRYGSYGISEDPTFSSARLSLLERGVVYAIAHIRGGGELGEAWHEGGRMMTKKNTFTDFISCADYLADNKYTAHDRLVVEGGSAGGLLIGATLNLRPDVCKAAVLAVPFVDVLNTMSDATLPLTTSEYIEWGNPTKKTYTTISKATVPTTTSAWRTILHPPSNITQRQPGALLGTGEIRGRNCARSRPITTHSFSRSTSTPATAEHPAATTGCTRSRSSTLSGWRRWGS